MWLDGSKPRQTNRSNRSNRSNRRAQRAAAPTLVVRQGSTAARVDPAKLIGVLSTWTVAGAADASAAGSTLAPPPIGSRVGPFFLDDVLGCGGMGIVYRAQDERLDRTVALKITAPGTADPQLLRREARRAAAVEHAHVATVFEVGEHDGYTYIAMELVDGISLRARLLQPMGEPEIWAVAAQIVDVLEHAHARGLVHRDLKPENVMLRPDGKVKVLDFGLAAGRGDFDHGLVGGTPGYMAPEQRDGSASQDARTDVWAAALLLCECLAGRVAEGAAPGDLTVVERAGVPETVRAVLAQALAANPDTRPGSAGELRVALVRAADRLAPAVAVPRPWRQRARLVALAVGAALAGGVAGWIARAPARIGAPPTNAEMNTSWEGRFGTLLLRVDDDGTVYGVYEHDDGILEGHYDHGVLVGWWCEQPSQRPPDDAGLVEMQFVRGARRVLIDGRWKYGADEKALWVRDWNGFNAEKPPAPELDQRMQRKKRCPAHPR
jgi:hypothetical protein